MMDWKEAGYSWSLGQCLDLGKPPLQTEKLGSVGDKVFPRSGLWFPRKGISFHAVFHIQSDFP